MLSQASGYLAKVVVSLAQISPRLFFHLTVVRRILKPWSKPLLGPYMAGSSQPQNFFAAGCIFPDFEGLCSGDSSLQSHIIFSDP